MKKILILLIVSLIILPCVIAKPFEWDIGISGTYNKSFNSLVNHEKIKVGDFSFGVDTNVKLTLIDIQGNALYSNINDESILNGIISANLSLDIFIVRLCAGIGYDYRVNLVNGEWEIAGKTDFENFFDNPFYLRTAVEILIGNLRVGPSATYFTGMSLKDFFSNLGDVNWKSVLEGATFGLSFKFSLF